MNNITDILSFMTMGFFIIFNNLIWLGAAAAIIYFFMNKGKKKTRFKGTLFIALIVSFGLPIILGIITAYIIGSAFLLSNVTDMVNNSFQNGNMLVNILWGLLPPVTLILLYVVIPVLLFERLSLPIKKLLYRFEWYYRATGENTQTPAEKYLKYLEENKTKLGLFLRTVSKKYFIVIANKYCVFSVDLMNCGSYDTVFSFLNKITGEETIIRGFIGHDKLYVIWDKILQSFNYETKAENLAQIVFSGNKNKKDKNVEYKQHKQLYLNINDASEAELTAIPGVTIAKAKRAVKMRSKYAFYLSMKTAELNTRKKGKGVFCVHTKGVSAFIHLFRK